MRVTVHKITTPRYHQVIAKVVTALVENKVVQVTALLVCIECRQALIGNDWALVTVVTLVVPEAIGPFVGDCIVCVNIWTESPNDSCMGRQTHCISLLASRLARSS